MTRVPKATSATVGAITPTCGAMLVCPRGPQNSPMSSQRPAVGLRLHTPQKAAGTRTLPPMSEPRPRGEAPAATNAASPPEEPPGVRLAE